jgi:N12 class adenine-specific DNA methylase
VESNSHSSKTPSTKRRRRRATIAASSRNWKRPRSVLTAKTQRSRRPREQGQCTLTFEELGVDQIFVDESDLYKNLGFVSKMNRIAGLPNSREQSRARYVHQDRLSARAQRRARRGICHRHADIQHHGRNVHAAALLSPRRCLPQPVSSILTHGPRTSASGHRPLNSPPMARATGCTRALLKFVNLPELLSMFRTFRRCADRRHAETCPGPMIEGGKPHVIAAPASPR